MKGGKSRTPWLVWDGGTELLCQRCGARPTIPTGCSLMTVVKYLRAVERDHAHCSDRPPDEPKPEE